MTLTRAQKILIIITSLVLIVVVIFWFIIKRGPSLVPLIVTPQVVTPPVKLPSVGPAQSGAVTPVVATPVQPAAGTSLPPVTSVITQSVAAAHFGKDGQLYYFQPSDGYFYRLTPGGTPQRVTDQGFTGAQQITWSSSRDQAVMTFPDGANILRDFTTGRQVVLPKNWRDFSFSQSGDKFEFKIINDNPDRNWLAVANTDGSQVRAFQPLGDNADKVTVSWSPTGQIAGWYTEAKDLDRHEVFFLGFNGENYRSMLVEGYNPIGQWSPSGQRLLYSTVSLDIENGYPPTLWVVAASGDNIGRGRLQLPANTWADKCIFANETTVYCAVPRELPFGSGFERNKVIGGDDLYRIDLTTGLKSSLAYFGNVRYAVKDLLLSPDDKTLYFVDQGTGNLHQVNISTP